MAEIKCAVNRHFMCPFVVAGQLQVSMETIGLGFSRKSQLCAGVTVRETSSVRNTFGTGRINFLRRKRSWYICEGPAYNLITGV
jgi:hypothetical protein